MLSLLHPDTFTPFMGKVGVGITMGWVITAGLVSAQPVLREVFYQIQFFAANRGITALVLGA